MREKLVRSIDLSLNWLEKQLDNFVIPDYSYQEQKGITKEKKAFGELALSLIVLKRSSRLISDPRVKRIKNHIHTWALSPNFVSNMQKDISLFPFYLMAYVSLREVGIEIESYRKILAKIVQYGYVNQVEQTPWQLSDLKFFLSKGGFENEIPDYKSLYMHSSLRFLPNPLFHNIMDSYAITHLLFFMTDFGNADISNILGDKLTETKSYVEVLTKMYVHNRDWDLLGELLISCHILRHRDFKLHRKCFEYYLDSQNQEGDFISRNALEIFDQNGSLSRKERFQANYHPTLVGLLCCVLEYEYIMSNEYKNEQVTYFTD